MVSHRPAGLWIVDSLTVGVVEVARPNLSGFFDRVVENLLMVDEFVRGFLPDFRFRLKSSDGKKMSTNRNMGV